MFWFWCQTGVGVQLNTKTQIQDQRSSTIQPLIILASSPKRKKACECIRIYYTSTDNAFILVLHGDSTFWVRLNASCLTVWSRLWGTWDHMVGLQESCPHKKTLRFSVVLRTGSWTENTASLYLLLVSMAVTAMLAFLWCELMPQVFWNEIPVTNRVKNPRSKADKLGLCSDLQEAFQATVIFGERVSMQSWSTTIAVLEVVFALGFCLVMLQLKAETSANIYMHVYTYIRI